MRGRSPIDEISMITVYHRPQTVPEALALIARSTPRTLPLGGGTVLSHGQVEPVEVADLQALGLNQITKSGNNLELGATATLQQLLNDEHCPEALRSAVKLEAPLNLRNAATVAGTLVVGDGRSTFVTALLALDAQLTLLHPTPESVGLGEFLPLRASILPGKLISSVGISSSSRLAFEYVSRTPADKPIVCVALAQWPSGRTRLAVGGCGLLPILAMDGADASGMAVAARNALHDGTDPWGSAEYRMDVAATLSMRCVQALAA
jgi:putative selenate reductase FAD-binding subunit